MDNFFLLSQGEVNKKYYIVDIKARNKVKRRLLELGFVDCYVEILKKSTLRGVFLLQLRNFVIALKRKEVESIVVKV